MHGLAHTTAHVNTGRRRVDISDLVGINPTKQPLEQAVLVSKIDVHHVDGARALGGVGIRVKIGQAQDVTRLVDKSSRDRKNRIALPGARRLGLKSVDKHARAQLLAVEGVLRAIRRGGVDVLLGPPCRGPLATISGKLQVDGIDVAIVVGVALTKIHLVVNGGQNLVVQGGQPHALVVRARVRRGAAHDLRGLKVQATIARAQVVGIDALVGVVGRAGIGLAVKDGEKILVGLGGGDDLGFFAAIGAGREAHADHDRTSLAGG